MTLLLAIAAWLLVLWLIAGLCTAARLGDRDLPRPAGWGRAEQPVWEMEHVVFSAHAGICQARPADASAALVQAGNAAA